MKLHVSQKTLFVMLCTYSNFIIVEQLARYNDVQWRGRVRAERRGRAAAGAGRAARYDRTKEQILQGILRGDEAIPGLKERRHEGSTQLPRPALESEEEVMCFSNSYRVFVYGRCYYLNW